MCFNNWTRNAGWLTREDSSLKLVFENKLHFSCFVRYLQHLKTSILTSGAIDICEKWKHVLLLNENMMLLWIWCRHMVKSWKCKFMQQLKLLIDCDIHWLDVHLEKNIWHMMQELCALVTKHLLRYYYY